ncbi:unnamed protein product, partial [Ixodes pacificus]
STPWNSERSRGSWLMVAMPSAVLMDTVTCPGPVASATARASWVARSSCGLMATVVVIPSSVVATRWPPSRSAEVRVPAPVTMLMTESSVVTKAWSWPLSVKMPTQCCTWAANRSSDSKPLRQPAQMS